MAIPTKHKTRRSMDSKVYVFVEAFSGPRDYAESLRQRMLRDGQSPYFFVRITRANKTDRRFDWYVWAR